MQKVRLLTPGPTMVPPQVLAEMNKPMDHHRTDHFRQMLKEITEGLQYVFQTEETCLVMAGSGTAAMEAAIINTCHPGGKALVVCNGKFSERWAKVCETFNIDYAAIELEWGMGAKPELIAGALKIDPKINTVIVTHSETTTAALSDVEGIARITRDQNCLLAVDGITSVGAIPVKTDEWGIDVMVTSSQKALMTPPGLGMIAVNHRAWERIDSFEAPALYSNLKAYRDSLKTNDSPYTPATTLMMGLRKALEMIREEGIENIWNRSARLAWATRAAIKAMNLEVYAADPVDSLTAVKFPDRFDVSTFHKRLRTEYGIQTAGGQGKLKGKIIRISHMGYVDEADTLAAINAMELLLNNFGHSFTLGNGTQAALEILSS